MIPSWETIRRALTPQLPAAPETLGQLEHAYLAFCTHRSQASAKLLQDLANLRGDPFFIRLGFYTDQEGVTTLFLATQPVVINYKRRRYAIGEFLLHVQRKDPRGEAAPRVLIENLTPTKSSNGGPVLCHSNPTGWHQRPHPHCGAQMHEFCMTEGMQQLREELATGNLPEALAIVKIALHTYDDLRPFCDINNWPTLPEENVP